MKIMMVGSIRNDIGSDKALLEIIHNLENEGHNVVHEHITQTNQKDIDSMTQEEDLKFHKNIIKNIKNSDIVISECSHQSLSVGYLLSSATDLGRPVIIFYSSSADKPNLFPTLTNSGKFFLVEYSSVDELKDLVNEYVDYAKEQVDVRFNFFISPAIANYLDWISKVKKIPRSVYLRALIEREMEENKEYN